MYVGVRGAHPHRGRNAAASHPMSFANLGLAEPLVRAVTAEGYETPTPVQAGVIPPAAAGRDVLASAQTGTGKTAAFALPILHRLSTTKAAEGTRRMRALILCPTRELATQIKDAFAVYGKHATPRIATIFGGVNQRPQVDALKRGVEIVVATPGRLMDLMNQGFVDLGGVETFVLDEADRMLDMGFMPDIKMIAAKLPPTKQTLLLSATLPTEIRRLANTMLRDPAVVDIAPVKATAALIEQCVYQVDKAEKPKLLARLVNELAMFRTIAFTRTKHGADRLTQHLNRAGIAAEAIHGNKSQNARNRALANFKSGRTPVLVATDVAARGIDVDNISHVVNYDITNEPETYLHRIGRTGRAGATGHAIAFCNREEVSWLRAIERLLKVQLPVKESLWGQGGTEAAAANEERGDDERREHHRPPQQQQRMERQQQDRQQPRPQHPIGNRPAGVGHKPAAHNANAGKPAGHRKGGHPGRPNRPGGGARPGNRPGGGGGRRPAGR